MPANSIPPKPTNAHFHASGPRFTRNSETICWLPGGRKLVKSEIKSNSAVRPPMGLVAKPTAISRVGKNARKRLKAIACEIMLHRGNTRANTRYILRKISPPESMASHYTCDGYFMPESARIHRHALDIFAKPRDDNDSPGPPLAWL